MPDRGKPQETFAKIATFWADSWTHILPYIK